MDTSAVRGLAFFGILFVASLLLADRKLLRPRQDPEQRFWLVRPGYRRQARALDRLLIALFSALGGWLVFSHIQAQLPDVEPARVEQAITLRAR
jgi:hypothetical protein